MEDNAKVCPSCGAPVAAAKAAAADDLESKVQSLNNTADTTGSYNQADIQQNKTMGVLAYLGLLVLIPLFAAKNSTFARYHTNQGLMLCAAEIAASIAARMLLTILPYGPLWRIVSWAYYLCGISFLVLLIIGIVNVSNGRAKELPVIGSIRLLK